MIIRTEPRTEERRAAGTKTGEPRTPPMRRGKATAERVAPFRRVDIKGEEREKGARPIKRCACEDDRR